MISPRVRRVALLVCALGVLFVSTSCASTLSDAATITYHDAHGSHTIHIGRGAFEQQLRELVANKEFVAALGTSKGDGANTTDATLTAAWLNYLINRDVLRVDFDARHIAVSPTDVNIVKNERVTFDPSVLTRFSPKLHDSIVDMDAHYVALVNWYAACHGTGKAVAHILVPTLAQANSILAQVRAGASFAELAQRDSRDTASAPLGGMLGCLGLVQYVKPFQHAADQAPVGQPVGPVHTQFGYHIILVTPWNEQAVRANQQLAQQAQQQALQAASDALNALLVSAHVWIDPRFGTWGTITDAQGQRSLAVRPPAVPAPRDAREPSPSTTVAPASG